MSGLYQAKRAIKRERGGFTFFGSSRCFGLQGRANAVDAGVGAGGLELVR